MDRILVRKDTYFDSVYLMALSAELGKMPALEAGHVLLATVANHALLVSEGFAPQDLAGLGPTDLVIALRAREAATLEAAAIRAEALLAAPQRDGQTATELERPLGLAGGLVQLPGANLTLISVPGEYAAYEAAKALALGLHVMIFSNNVSVEDEVSLKRRAEEEGLLVMGPDCGTALVGGKPLGFANRLRTDRIGLVGASGTGLQEVSCRIHRLGGGVTHLLGTGGRNLSAAVGGLSTLAAINALAADPATKVLVVVSKPPAREVADRVLARLAQLAKPTVVCFLGAAGARGAGPVHLASTLAEAAWLAVRLVRGDQASLAPEEEEDPAAAIIAHAQSPAQRWLHGLFCGGTLGGEALLVLRHRLGQIVSNLDHGPSTGAGHTLTDLGDDAYTQGRPHPMIDPSLRQEHILRLGTDPTTAVLLLDLVLGSGSHPDPSSVTVPAVHQALARNPGLAVVASITGTDLDPQGLERQESTLRAAGIHVRPSNVSAARLAASIIEQKESRR